MSKDLQDILYSEIPLTRAIGIEVKEYTGDSLTLCAPIENNLNHKCTAFGGSLYSVAVLSGWGLVYMLLRQHDSAGHIVIHESNTKFLRPVSSTIMAKCAFDSREQTDRFMRTYQRKGKARIQLQSHVYSDTDIGVMFTGSYVVHT